MQYHNPIIKGFYPDPSICKANGKYYLVTSSMQYFPGVPLFESEDLLNWKQIGHCLTRPEQIQLEGVNSSGGVFAPSIRYHKGRFYMTTTNDTTHQNFYIWTDNIYGEWSDPIFVDQDGIDPSFFFEGDKAYFISNGTDSEGKSGIILSELDIETGKKISPSRAIWQGTGGRFPEGPHLYHIGKKYLLMIAEGGTEYGHMVTCATADNPFGPYTSNPRNPVLTNRNLGGYSIQGIGHGDLIADADGNWWMVTLGFRQIGQWMAYHHLGREVFLVPVTFQEDDFFTAGENGVVRETVTTDRMPETLVQQKTMVYTFSNTEWDKDWCFLRIPDKSRYGLEADSVTLYGTATTLQMAASPTFIGLRQRDFCADMRCTVSVDDGEAGITLYMDENHHYDLAVQKTADGWQAMVRLNIGEVKTIQNAILIPNGIATLHVRAENNAYQFYLVQEDGTEVQLAYAQTRYLSSEVAGGFTGVIIGLYAQHPEAENKAEFRDFSVIYDA